MTLAQTAKYWSLTLTLILIHPVSNWTHWATLRRHPCLSRAATSDSSQVNPIFRRSLLITPLQFAVGRPGPLLYPGTCQYSAFVVAATQMSNSPTVKLRMKSLVSATAAVVDIVVINWQWWLWWHRSQEAQDQYETALKYDSTNPDLYYNVTHWLFLSLDVIIVTSVVVRFISAIQRLTVWPGTGWCRQGRP